jgi:hypothetical protein
LQAGWLLLGALALAAGTGLRVWQLDGQILIDDEWHAVHRLLAADVSQIVTRLGYADYSIPLTVAFRVLYDYGMLSERWMHIPAACAGIALLLVGPWLARRWFSLPALVTWMALLAISPLLVYHSMVARPYAFTVLLTLISIVALRRWWQDGSRPAAAAYVVSTCLAGYLHAVTLPFVLMPLAYYGIAALRDRRRLAGCIVVGLITALLIAVTLGPPVINDWQQFTAKAGKDHVTVESVYRSWLMLAGSQYAAVLAAIVALAAYGWWRVRQRDRRSRALPAGDQRRRVDRGCVERCDVDLPSAGLRALSHSRSAVPAAVRRRRHGRPRRARAARGSSDRGRGCRARLLPRSDAGHRVLPQSVLGPPALPVRLRPRENRTSRRSKGARAGVLSRARGAAARVAEADRNAVAPRVQLQSARVVPGSAPPARDDRPRDAVCGTWSFGEYPETRTGLRMRHFAHLSALLRGETYAPTISSCTSSVEDATRRGDRVARHARVPAADRGTLRCAGVARRRHAGVPVEAVTMRYCGTHIPTPMPLPSAM